MKNKPQKYVVVIPSYNRPKMIQEKTLVTLQNARVPSSAIHIFVADEAEAKVYKDTIPSNLYNKIIVGQKGITNQRRFISSYFPKHTHIVSMDDDVAQVLKLNDTGKLTELDNLHVFFQEAFHRCLERNIYLWGIYPVLNAFYMKPTITTDLKFILGTCHGYINRPNDPTLAPVLPEKEDFEMSILYYLKDGGVMRFNYVALKTKFHNRQGGLGALSDERLKANEFAAQELKRRYPTLGYVWYRKNTRVPEFRFYPTRSHGDPKEHKDQALLKYTKPVSQGHHKSIKMS